MKVTIVTLFPEIFKSPFSTSIILRAREKGLLDIDYVNIFDFGLGKRKQTDDTPYGGGPGMILRVDVVARAIDRAKKNNPGAKIILLTPKGKRFTQTIAKNLVKSDKLILVCGHYEGFDERIRKLVDEELSLGDFVLSGGEAAAIAIIDALNRLIPGVLGKKESTVVETHSQEGYMEYPQYTRPKTWQGLAVPEILLSGNHQKIADYREKTSRKKEQ